MLTSILFRAGVAGVIGLDGMDGVAEVTGTLTKNSVAMVGEVSIMN